MPWDGTPTELHGHIWGRTITLWGERSTPAAMSQELKRIAPALRHVGVDVTWARENDRNRTRKIAVRAVRAVQNEAGGGPLDREACAVDSVPEQERVAESWEEATDEAVADSPVPSVR